MTPCGAMRHLRRSYAPRATPVFRPDVPSVLLEIGGRRPGPPAGGASTARLSAAPRRGAVGGPARLAVRLVLVWLCLWSHWRR
jgi:hypothetical protein